MKKEKSFGEESEKSCEKEKESKKYKIKDKKRKYTDDSEENSESEENKSKKKQKKKYKKDKKKNEKDSKDVKKSKSKKHYEKEVDEDEENSEKERRLKKYKSKKHKEQSNKESSEDEDKKQKEKKEKKNKTKIKKDEETKDEKKDNDNNENEIKDEKNEYPNKNENEKKENIKHRIDENKKENTKNNQQPEKIVYNISGNKSEMDKNTENTKQANNDKNKVTNEGKKKPKKEKNKNEIEISQGTKKDKGKKDKKTDDKKEKKEEKDKKVSKKKTKSEIKKKEEENEEEEDEKNEDEIKKHKSKKDKKHKKKEKEKEEKDSDSSDRNESSKKVKKSQSKNLKKKKYEHYSDENNSSEEKAVKSKNKKGHLKNNKKDEEEDDINNVEKEKNHSKSKKKNDKKKKKDKHEDEDKESSSNEEEHSKNKKDHSKKNKKYEDEESSSNEENYKRNKKDKYKDNSSEEKEHSKIKKKHKKEKRNDDKNKKINKRNKDGSDSDSSREQKIEKKQKSKNNKNQNKSKKKNSEEEEDSSNSDKKENIESSSDSEEKQKKRPKKKNNKKEKGKNHNNSSDSDSNRENRFSKSNSFSSNSTKEKKNIRHKSSMTYKEKEKKEKNEEKQKTSSAEEEEQDEIINNLKNDRDIPTSESKSYEESEDENKTNKIHLENKERTEENVIKHTKIVKEIKTAFDTIVPKNQSKKFLMDEKNNNNNKDSQRSIQEIIDNFLHTDSVIKKYISEFKSDEKKKKFFKKQGFILTEKSMERMALLIHYILNGVPVLFEGNTGTSKTRTTLTACNYIKKFIQKEDENKRELIRYNLSAETKIDDIIAKYVSDQDSIIGLIVQNGPFVDAYINGKIILFDEINLAPVNVLQCIQQSLDNGFLSVETNGRCLLKYKKNPNFALVATQNPNKGTFIGKRQELGPEFLSRFQKIYFPDISKEEMQEIALGIARNVEYLKSNDKNDKDDKNKRQLLKDIVNLHFEWAKETDSQADIQCFTIREIESVIECLSNKEDPYNVIMTIYGGRFRQDKKEKLKMKLKNFDSLLNLKEESKSLPDNFPKCFINNALIQTVKSVLLALRNKRNVIITGNDESGLTQVAEWCSQYFNQEKEIKKTNESFICFCTKNLECSDLIGTQKIGDSLGDDNELIKFEPRFLYKAIEEGNCVVLDCINEAPSRVIERLNGLLDKKNSKKEEVFEVPENSADPEIIINKDFRIICTSNFDKINQISPAFVNRFEVVVLEDQLKGLTESQIKNFIKLLCNKYQKECHDNYKKRREKIKKSNKKIKKKVNDLDDVDDPFENANPNKKNCKVKLKIDKEIDVDDEMMNLILSKYRILSQGRNPNESIDDTTSASSIADKDIDENSKKYLTMSSINKFCRSLIILINKFKVQTHITLESIIDFTFELLFEEHLSPNKNELIQKYLIEELIESNKHVGNLGEEQYYFDKSESLKRFMVQMYACSLVNQYLCIIGPPGIGKTIGARAFSFIREIIFKIKYESPFYMHTFNQFTRPSDYFGISSLKDEKLIFRDGTLTKSIKQGNVFIGDEFNISSEDCMKAITPILELKFCEDFLIPGIEDKISIDPDFFFIICQNTKNTFGRKDLPEKIKVKIKVINYPDRIKEEIENICESICENLFKGRGTQKLTKKEARLCGDFMMALNEREVLTPWSLRDISKLFARINKQSINPKNYEGLNVQENILFYILSSTNNSLISERLKVVVDLICDTFKLSENEKNDLMKLYNAPPYIKKRNEKIYIEKGTINIFYCNYEKEIYKKLNGLPSILNALLKILIASDDEPILISGPSSFKTFLAKLLFHNGKSDVISLNSESTISQLIGSATLLTSEKAKNYYLMQIYEILQANNIDNLLKDLENFEANKEKIRKNIKELIKIKNIKENYAFYYALEHFIDKLFKVEKGKKSLFDMIIEFKPGIFISARIKGCNLILKNITYVKTENLERLNEALTGNKKITLNEDTQNSFTSENNKEISFSNDFRIVGTCNEGEETSLSDAFLSRFTLIYVNKYKEPEELKVLKDTADDIKDIKYLNKLLDKYYSIFPDTNRMNLSQKINCFNITKEIDKIRKNNYSHHENLKLVAYYLLKGLNERREEKIKEINNIFNINEYYDNKNNDSPIEIVKNQKESFVKSKLNDLIMNINPELEKKTKKEKDKDNGKDKKENSSLVFTHKIKEILDTIHFCLSSKTPLILEGEYGQGKQSALQYYAKMAKLELVQVPISKSTKVDDLLSKTTFKKNKKGNFSLVNSKTPLCHAIECVDNFPRKLVVLEGINNATPAILEILNSIYGKKGTNILLPNGSKIIKGNMNLISIFNPSDDFTREKLPGNLLNNSLYYIVENPSKNDIVNIISYLFEEAGLSKGEQEEFTINFLKAQKIAKEGVGEFPITLHEVRKYISFRKSIPKLDKTIFMTFIFNYHFSQKENIYKAQKELKLDTFLFNPRINYDGSKKYLTFKSSKKGKNNQLKVEIKNPDKIKTDKLINKFNSMTFNEKLCFLFLICCVIAKKTPIIQGVTASGKSFIIKLLAEVLGQDLSIYQLNSNSGISLFTGQSVMKEEFDKKEKEKLKNILKLLNKKDKKIKDINSKDFSNFQKKIEKKLSSGILSKEEKKQYEEAKDTLTILKSPLNRFMHQDSELVNGIKMGKWIALDGIEMASTQISEKLSPLCGEVPTLNIFESGLEDLNFDFSNINPNFRLFIIYNPSSQNSKKIDQSLFNKCIKFTMPSIDGTPRDATTMLYESIMNKTKDKDISLWSNLCARIARYHIEETKKSRENTDLVAGNVPFTSRNLCFIANDFHRSFIHNKNITIESWLQSVFDNYYWRSFINYSQIEKKKCMEDTLNIIKAVPDQQYKVDQEVDFTEEFKEIIEYLIEIQKYAGRNIEYREFDFKDFLNYCLKVPINKDKLQSIYNNLEDTIVLLDHNHNMDETLKNKFYQINFIKNNYENILNNFRNVSGFEDKLELINDQLLKNEDIKNYLLRMRFLNLLIKSENKKIYDPNLNYELFNSYSNELSKKLYELIKFRTKNYFEELVLFLFEFPESFKIIHYYYPYNVNELKEGELKYANYYIYFWYNLFIKKYNFSVRLKNERYDIIFPDEDQDKKVNPYFILNEKNSLMLSKNSFLKKNIKNIIDNSYDYRIVYLDKMPEENTQNMFKWLTNNINTLYKESPLKSLDEINDLQLETTNFFTNNSSTLISRIWSLLMNLNDKFSEVIKYLKKSCCFLEKDVIEIFEFLYNNLDASNLNNIIKNVNDISFFCENKSESMLWKYRILLNNLELEEKEKKDTNNYCNYFRTLNTDADEEISLIKNELNNISKLIIYWSEKRIDIYKGKLLTLQNLIVSYKNKDNEDAEITKLRVEANALIILLETKTKNSTSSIKSLNFLKDEITKFTTSNKPTKEQYKILKNKVKIFINLIGKEKETKLDLLNLPNKDQMKLIESKNNKIYELIFWFSFIEENLNRLFAPDITEKTSMELIMDLYKDSELDPIMTFISEKKLEISGENQNLSFKDQKKVKQMLRGILINKIRNNQIDLNDFNNIVKTINSKINNTEEISDEEYYFSYIISDKYPKNLKLRMPIFEPIDIFYLFYKYNKYNKYKLGEIFNRINCNFGGIQDIANEILYKKEYDNMIDLSEYIGKLFYQNICGKDLNNEDSLNMIEFLNNEAEKEKDSKNIKELLKTIASSLNFIKLFQEKIYKNQKEEPENYEFKLDDFNNLLNDKNKLMNCSSLFKKEKELKDTDKNKSIYSPSFIFYINNNQTFINDLFNSINISNTSIISDLNRKRKIDYLPFWLYILRNISSLNCLEYCKKDIDESIRNHIADRIKKKITYYLNNNKPLNFRWLNLLLDNISSEILDPKIHLFHNFFNSLINNLNITGKNLKIFARNELENYFYEIIDSVFNESIDKLLDKNINENKGNLILEFTKDPSNYLFKKIKDNINNKFNEIMDKDNIYNLNVDFNKQIKNLSENFIIEIKKINEKLFEKEYQNLKDKHNKKVNDEFVNLCKYNSDNISSIDKIITKKEFGNSSNKQISDSEIKNLKRIQQEILKYKKNGIKEKEEEKLIFYTLSYDFTKMRNKEYILYFMDKYVETDNETHKGIIYIVYDKNDDKFKKLFKIQIIPEDNDDESKNRPVDKDLNEGELKKINIEAGGKMEEEEEKVKKEKEDCKPEDYIDFKNAKKSIFSKFDIENEEEIKNSIERGIKSPTKNDVKNPPEILLSDYNVVQFSNFIENLKKSSDSLLEIFKNIKEKTISDNSIVCDFENEIENITQFLDKVKGMLKLNHNDYDELNNCSKDLEKEISEFSSNLSKYYYNYESSVKELLSEFFNIKESNLFSLDFALPIIPENISKSNIYLDKINKDSENLSVPIINIDSEGKNLICCYKSLELNLGKTCPAFYYKPYVINIISFVNEDITVKIKSYKESKIDNKEKKEEKKEKQEKEEKGEEKEKEEEIEEKIKKEEKPIAIYEDEVINKYLSVKESIKKRENIQLFVEIPQTFEEDTIQISSVLNIESISGKKLDLNVNIILTTMPISVLISCKEYKLIKEKINYDSTITFEQCFKLDTKEFTGDEIINFELLNYKEKEDVEFYISAKSLENNSSNMPIFSRSKQKNQFKVTIPRYDFNSNDNDIPRLFCMLELFINKNFVIYIIIDALIKPNLNIFKIYDFYSKTYVENEMTIYLNERVQEIFKKDNRCICLNCILFSTYKDSEFTVVPDKFNGGVIQPFNGRIKNGKNKFPLFLQFENDAIKNGSYCNFNITINIKKIQFKIKFSYPRLSIFSDDYYSHYGIEGKNQLYENWNPLNNNENTTFYVTPFNFSQNEIDYRKITSEISGLKFYYINKKGNISSSPKYEKEQKKKRPFLFIYRI